MAKKQGYIINLGNNDIYLYKQQIGSAKDINVDDPSLNPDTYFGYLGKVISKLKSLEKDSFIFLVSMQIDHLSKEKDETSKYVAKEMEKVTKMFTNTFLIDITTYGPVYDEKLEKNLQWDFILMRWAIIFMH